MSEKQLTPEQNDKVKKIKQQWIEEAEIYLSNTSPRKAQLDGERSAALAQIQNKYKKQIQKAIQASE